MATSARYDVDVFDEPAIALRAWPTMPTRKIRGRDRQRGLGAVTIELIGLSLKLLGCHVGIRAHQGVFQG